MREPATSNEPLVRLGFDLLLEIRGHPEARRLLIQATTFLKMLLRDTRTDDPPVVMFVRTLRVPNT